MLNVLGCVSLAAMSHPGPGRGPVGLDVFLLDEDTDCIIVSERVFQHLDAKGYHDLFFEEFPVVHP